MFTLFNFVQEGLIIHLVVIFSRYQIVVVYVVLRCSYLSEMVGT